MYMESNKPINEQTNNILVSIMGGSMAATAGYHATNYYGMKQIEHTKSDIQKMSKADFSNAVANNTLPFQAYDKIIKTESKLENAKGMLDEMKIKMTDYNDAMNLAIEEQKQYKTGIKKTLASSMSTTGKRAAIAGAAGLAGGAITYLINK